jgi:hypothetical protein
LVSIFFNLPHDHFQDRLGGCHQQRHQCISPNSIHDSFLLSFRLGGMRTQAHLQTFIHHPFLKPPLNPSNRRRGKKKQTKKKVTKCA